MYIYLYFYKCINLYTFYKCTILCNLFYYPIINHKWSLKYNKLNTVHGTMLDLVIDHRWWMWLIMDIVTIYWYLAYLEHYHVLKVCAWRGVCSAFLQFHSLLLFLLPFFRCVSPSLSLSFSISFCSLVHTFHLGAAYEIYGFYYVIYAMRAVRDGARNATQRDATRRSATQRSAVPEMCPSTAC